MPFPFRGFSRARYQNTRVPKVDIAGEDRGLNGSRRRTRSRALRAEFPWMRFIGGEGGNRWRGISVFFPRKNGWYESDIRGKLRRNNSWEYVVALVQDSWLNFRLYISASSLFRLNRVRARLGKVEEVGRRNSEINFKNDSSSLDSFWMRAFTSFDRDRLSIRKRFLMILISLRY